MLVLGIVLLVSSLSVYSADEDTHDLGEVISVSVDHTNIPVLTSDRFMARNYQVNVDLKGFTLGSFLFGEDAPESAPFFGDLKLRYFDVFTRGSTSNLVSGVSYILPRGNKVSFNKDGVIDLGPMIIILRREAVEDKIPEEIVLNLTAKYGIDGTGEFGIFGAESLLLSPEPNEDVWLKNVGDGNYDFWAERGYLRLVEVGTNRATFQLYDGSLRKIGLPFDLRKGEEEERSLPGGPSFLRKIARFKLESTTSPNNIAVLVTEKDGIVKDNVRVAKGMSPFTGSSWKIHQIYPGSDDGAVSPKIVFKSEDPERRGDRVVLEHKPSGNFVLGNPCTDVELVKDEEVESFEDSNSQVEKTKLACTAIFEFEAALDYGGSSEERDDIYKNIAETYMELKAPQMAISYYNLISSGDYSETISILERQIESGSAFITLDGVTVFLKDIEDLEDKKSHFTAEVHGGASVDEINTVEELQNKIAQFALSKDIPVDVALGLVEHESRFKHCEEGNPPYDCDNSVSVIKNENTNDEGEVVSTDYGLMQINDRAHPGCYDANHEDGRGICAITECDGKYPFDITCNMAAGLTLLKQKYDEVGQEGVDPDKIPDSCSHVANQYLAYRGWDAALRMYNGLGCAGSAPDYVDNVNGKRGDYVNFEVTGTAEGSVVSDKFYVGQTLLTYRDDDNDEVKWVVDSISSDSVVIKVRGFSRGTEELVVGDNLVDGYLVRVIDINAHENAIVTVLPGSSRSYGSSDFTVTLPIEKRLIEWTPEQIDRKINKTKKTLDKIENVLDDLGKLIKAWKTTCFYTFFALTVKNSFIQDPTARRLVVEDWTNECRKNMDMEIWEYDSVDDCLRDKGENIEDDIDGAGDAVEVIRNYKKDSSAGLGDEATRNKIADELGIDRTLMRQMQNYTTLTIDDFDQLVLEKYTEDEEDFDEAIGRFLEENSGDLFDEIDTAIGNLGEDATDEDVRAVIDSKLNKQPITSLEELSDADAASVSYLNSRYAGSVNNIKQLNYIVRSGDDFIGYYDGVGVNLDVVNFDGDEDRPISIDGRTVYASGGGELYIVEYVGGSSVYSRDYSGRPQVQFNGDRKPWIFPYKERAPFGKSDDEKWKYLNHANYVRVYYTASGEYDGFEVWNVGKDRHIDLAEGTGEEDDRIVVSRSQLDFDPEFNTLKQRIIATYQRIDRNPNEGDPVWVQGERYAASYLKSRVTDVTPLSSCLYHMPESDCRILFNVCDPVMCPASRFDLGGRWKVSNVIETGIIGSLVLGWGNGDIVPICVSGVHAGLDNIRSVVEGYHDCLQTAKVEGKYVGVCNEITSIYVCEMLWREALSISGAFGKLSDAFSSKFLGSSWSEGGEYSRWRASWQSLSDSTKFFTSEYARSSFAAFTSRSSQDIGTEICKAAIGGKVPGGGDFLSQLTDPTSPPQFTAWFSEMEDGGLEVGTSTYRIYYHIYAGRDRDIKYSVFLKNNLGEFVYVTGADEGFVSRRKNLEKGDYSDVSAVVQAKSGFTEICVEIDGTVKCGFGKITSAFSANHINDLLVRDELGRSDITTQEQCVPEHPRTTPSLGSVPTPSNYGLLDSGIVRVCAGNDPDGYGDKWLLVGSCGVNEEGLALGDCYLDSESVSFNDRNKAALVDDIKGEAIERYLNGSYRNETESEERLNNAIGGAEKGDTFVEDLIERPYNEIKAKLGELRDVARYSTDDGSKSRVYTLIGKIYKSLAQKIVVTSDVEEGEGVVPGGDVIDRVLADDVADYDFFLFINDQLTREGESYNSPAGNDIYFDFGYEVGAQSNIVDRYKIEIINSNGNLVDSEVDDVWFGGDDKEGFRWRNPSRGTYLIRTTYSREDDFLPENLVNVDQFTLNIGGSYDNGDSYCIHFDCAVLDRPMEIRIGYNDITQWERRINGWWGWSSWKVLTDENWNVRDVGFPLSDSQSAVSEILKDSIMQEGISYLVTNWAH